MCDEMWMVKCNMSRVCAVVFLRVCVSLLVSPFVDVRFSRASDFFGCCRMLNFL